MCNSYCTYSTCMLITVMTHTVTAQKCTSKFRGYYDNLIAAIDFVWKIVSSTENFYFSMFYFP